MSGINKQADGLRVISENLYANEKLHPALREILINAADTIEILSTEIQQYRAIGTVEDFKKSDDVRKKVTEIVNRQLIAGKNNYKEVYGCFREIVDVVQENY